jgi:hypothetical protein
MFSVTLPGNVFQQWTLLCSQAHVFADWRPSHTYLLLFYLPYRDSTVIRIKVRVTLRLAVYRQSVRLGDKPLEAHDQHFFQLNTCCHIPYVTSSLTRGWVCRLQLLLALASAVILRSGSCGTHVYILLS